MESVKRGNGRRREVLHSVAVASSLRGEKSLLSAWERIVCMVVE